MNIKLWLALILVLFLAGCAAGTYSGYEPSYNEEPKPWYLRDRVPPLPVSPEVLGSVPDHHNQA